jgi:hypothetical protein
VEIRHCFTSNQWSAIMPEDSAKKFIAESARFRKFDLAKSVETGPTIWLLGSPASAPDGLVGLATTPTQMVCFRSEDILVVREADGRFLINLPADTNFLVREEQVVRLNPGNCQCHEQEKQVAARAGEAGRVNSGPIIIDCTTVCSFETVCGPWIDPTTRAIIVVCWPKFVCRNPCEGIPA